MPSHSQNFRKLKSTECIQEPRAMGKRKLKHRNECCRKIIKIAKQKYYELKREKMQQTHEFEKLKKEIERLNDELTHSLTVIDRFESQNIAVVKSHDADAEVVKTKLVHSNLTDVNKLESVKEPAEVELTVTTEMEITETEPCDDDDDDEIQLTIELTVPTKISKPCNDDDDIEIIKVIDVKKPDSCSSLTVPTKSVGKNSENKVKVRKPRKSYCGHCNHCIKKDCRTCKNCLDKPKFGGENKKRQRCLERKCLEK